MRRPRDRRSSVLRRAHALVFAASRDGRAFEIVVWSNALASAALAAGTQHLCHAWPLTVTVGLVGFVLLRVALVHPVTIWLAASLGSLGVAATAGTLAWLFGHVVERPAAPAIAAVLVAVGSSTVPAWAYARLAERRVNAERPRDSLLDPVSVPSSYD